MAKLMRVLGRFLVVVVWVAHLFALVTLYITLFNPRAIGPANGEGQEYKRTSLSHMLGWPVMVTIILSWISHIMCACTHPGRIPPKWEIGGREERAPILPQCCGPRLIPKQHEPVWLQSASGVSLHEICDQCQIHKPPRAHHCSVCERCCMLYDHHCPWIGNCVGLMNRKYFLSFLVYSFLSCLGAGGCMTYVWFEQRHLEWPAIVLMILACFFGLSGLLMLLMHGYLLFYNRTTVELHSINHSKNPYDRGCVTNTIQICGTRWWCWWLPVNPYPSPSVHFRGGEGGAPRHDDEEGVEMSPSSESLSPTLLPATKGYSDEEVGIV